MSDLVDALHAELAAIHGITPDGHSLTGDYAALKADAERLARVVERHTSDLAYATRFEVRAARTIIVKPSPRWPGSRIWTLWPEDESEVLDMASDQAAALARARELAQDA